MGGANRPPTSAPATRPGANPAVAPVAGTLFKKPPPTTPPNSHCWANAAVAAHIVKTESVRTRIVNSFSLMNYPDVKCGCRALLVDRQRNGETQGHVLWNQSIDLV